MENTKLKQEIWAYILLIVGSFLFAAGDVMFVNPYHLAPGGTYGLSNVFYSLWGWKISYWAICMDIPLLLIGTWILGPKFGIKTIVSTFLIFGFTWVLETLWGYKPVIFEGAITSNQISETMIGFSVGGDALNYFTPDYFLNTVVAGLIYGVAIGLIFKSGATSGGSDIISMILHKYTKISLGTLVLIVDGCITISTLFIPGATFRLPIYSIIVIFIESKMIDIVVDGVKSYKTALIITDKVEDVRDYVLNTLHRGGTCFAGMGLFNGAERKMIYVTLERADLVKLKSNLRVLDPNAFVNILDSSEIMGLGFKALPEE